jgi:hypothetical protein
MPLFPQNLPTRHPETGGSVPSRNAHNAKGPRGWDKVRKQTSPCHSKRVWLCFRWPLCYTPYSTVAGVEHSKMAPPGLHGSQMFQGADGWELEVRPRPAAATVGQLVELAMRRCHGITRWSLIRRCAARSLSIRRGRNAATPVSRSGRHAPGAQVALSFQAVGDDRYRAMLAQDILETH